MILIKVVKLKCVDKSENKTVDTDVVQRTLETEEWGKGAKVPLVAPETLGCTLGLYWKLDIL